LAGISDHVCVEGLKKGVELLPKKALSLHTIPSHVLGRCSVSLRDARKTQRSKAASQNLYAGTGRLEAVVKSSRLATQKHFNKTTVRPD
jgi:hypothetical protein